MVLLSDSTTNNKMLKRERLDSIMSLLVLKDKEHNTQGSKK